MSLVVFQSIEWNLSGGFKGGMGNPHLELDASLRLPITVDLGPGINEVLHFAVSPRLDPEVKLSGGGVDLDLGSCPWYVGLTAPPRDLKVDAAHQGKETQARRDFLAKVLKAAGDDIRHVLDRLLALPRQVFAALRERLARYLDTVFGPWTEFLGIEGAVRTRIGQLVHAVEDLVRQAMGWVMSLARDVATWLLTTVDQLGGLAADMCHAVVEGTLVLYEGVLDGAGRLVEVLQASFIAMVKDPRRFAEQLKAAIVALVESAILHAKEFAADVENLLATAIAALVSAYGLAEDKLTALFRAVAKGILDGTEKAKVAAREACNFFCRLLESAVVALQKVADDPGVLYIWIGKLIRIGLEIFVGVSKATDEWLLWAAHAIGRAARGLGASVKDFAAKTAAELEPYVKPALQAVADLAKTFGKVTRKAFTTFLQKLAGWSRTVFHATCRVLHATQEILIALIGPENIEAVKQALKFLCDFFEEVGAKVNQAIESLCRFGRFVAIDLPRMFADVASAIGGQIAGIATSLGAMLEKLFRLLVLEIGGCVKRSPLYKALSAIVSAMLELAKAAGAAITEKGRQLGDWLRPKINDALAGLDNMAGALSEFIAGRGEGAVIEARFRSLSLAAPRASKRSGAKIKLLSDMPTVHKLPGDDVLLPVLQAIAGEVGLTLGAIELYSFADWRFCSPHPVSGLIDRSPHEVTSTRFLPVPFAPEQDVVFRLCTNPRMWVIDPRYSWGYGASNQLRLADIDGDGKVDEWEVRRTAQNRRDAKKKDPDADPFTAADLQTLLDQAKNVLHGVPYREIGAPFGLLAGYEEGSWTWFSIASIGDEDVGAQVQASADPKAAVGSLLAVGAGGSVIPSGEKVDRTGIGLFWQGMQQFGKTNYPLRYHVEKRIFWDQFASGFGNAGTSTFLVLRGGKGGNDFQLRGELYADLSGHGTLPIGIYTPTIRASFGFAASGAVGGAAQGGIRVGLEYASQAPIAVLMGDVAKDANETTVDKILKKLTDDFKVGEILPLLEKALVPVLRLLMFDQEFEAKLACAGAIAIGADLAIEKKRTWAREAEGRRRTLHVLDQAETFLDDWKQSEEVRQKDDDLRARTAANSKKATEKLSDDLKQLWAASRFNEEQRKDLTEIRQLHRAFMRFALKEPTSPEGGLVQRFEAWVADTRPPAKLLTFEGWLVEQRRSHYLAAAGHAADVIKNQLLAGNFVAAWEKVQAGVARVDASTGEYADEICECIIALASLVDIFYRMAVALGNVTGLKKKIADDLKKRREEQEKKAAAPPSPDDKPGPTILGRLGAQAHDDRWAQEVLADTASWGKQDTGLADGLSIVWSIDGGVGVGVGGSAGGAGLGAFAVAGLSVTPPSFKLPSELLKTLSSKLMLVRFGTKFMGALLEVINYQVAYAQDLPSEPSALLEVAIYWCVQAIHQTLQEVLNPGSVPSSDPKRGTQADPLEDWLFAFLSGTTISVGAKVEGLAKAVGTVASAEARGSLGGELSVTLASLIDPLVEALQHDATRAPGDKAPLGARSIPKVNFKVKQSLSAGVGVGPVQFEVGLSGQSLAADVIFPDGSPWRRKIEARMAELVTKAVESSKERGRVSALHKEAGGFLHGAVLLCRAVDAILRSEIPSVIDWEKKTGEGGPGVATALVTNPSIQKMFDTIRDPAAAQNKRDKKKERIDEVLEIIHNNELHFDTYPEQPGVGLKATPTSSYAFDVCVLLPDAEVGKLAPKSKVMLERRGCRIPLNPTPAHVAQDTFRRKGDPKAAPISGVVVGFAKKSEAVAFADKRGSGWVDSAVAAVPPWTSPRAGVSGTAQWYQWLNTALFSAIEDARGQGKRIDHPILAVDDKGVLLTFGLVDRDLLDKAPFSTFGMIKENQILLVEATILEGAFEDDVVRLRTEMAASMDRAKSPPPAAAPTPTAGSTPAAAGSPPAGSSPTATSQPAPAATPPPPAEPPVVPAEPPAPSEVLRYAVKRAQIAVNHRVREGGIPGWTKPLVTDGRFGAKTAAALDAWGKSLGAPPVKAEKGDTIVEVARTVGLALDEAQDAGLVAFSPPHKLPEDDAPWMVVARGEIGQKEIKGAEDNPRIREYHATTTMGEKADEIAWCSSFVNWVLGKAGVRGTRSAAAASWADWGVETDVRRGAVVVVYNAGMKNSSLTRSGNHVGFLVEDLGWGWKVLGGNQSDMVKESCFSKKKWALKAVRWPK